MVRTLAARLGITRVVKCIPLLCVLPSQVLPEVPDGFRRDWLALLHFSRERGAMRSDVDDPSFFIARDGVRDPDHEWLADRNAFLLPPNELHREEHAQCRFPARFALMRRALGWSERDVPRVVCSEFDEYKRRLRATSLSVVFVTNYLNNPSSAFGHTLLYLGSGSERGSAIADYSVSFEADISGMSSAAYMRRGLFGGLIAGFRVEPLYLRVRKYERKEQRDLWLFPLRVSQEEIDQLIRHLWELKDARFSYGYLRGNCAQKILEVIQAIAPDYQLLPYRHLAVLPSEVSRRLVTHVGLAGEPTYRPSLWSQYGRQVARLTREERTQLKEMETTRTVANGASRATLTAALLWSEFATPYRAFRRAADNEEHTDLLWRRALWMSRVALGDSSEIAMVPSIDEPRSSLLQSHKPSRIALRGEYRSGIGALVGVQAQWLLHGPVDPPAGYPAFSGLEVAKVDLAATSVGGLLVDEVTVLRIENLAPVSDLQRHLAWRVELGGRRLAHAGASPLHVGAEVSLGLGAARLRPSYSVEVYSMVGIRPGAAIASTGTSFLPAGILSGGLLLRLPSDFRGRVSTEYAVTLGSLKGGTGALRAVIRKGLTSALELELRVDAVAGRSAASIGFVSFR